MPTYTTPKPPARRPAAYEADSVTLRATVRGILRSWLIVIAAAVIAAAGAIAYSTTRPTTYRAAASLLFNDSAYQQVVAGGYNPIDAQRRLRTSAELIGLPAVDELAALRLRGEPRFRPDGARAEAEYSASSNRMLVVATAADGRSAALLANATADAFLDYRTEMIRSSLDSTRRVLRRQIRLAPTRSDRRGLVGKRNNLDAMQALDREQVQLAQPALASGSAAEDDTTRNALIALVLGALVGVGVSLFRVREPQQVLPDPWGEGEPSQDRA